MFCRARAKSYISQQLDGYLVYSDLENTLHNLYEGFYGPRDLGLEMSLYLVIMDGRRGCYFRFADEQLVRNVLPIVSKYGLYIERDPHHLPDAFSRNVYLITKEPIDLEQFANNHDMYLAEMLDYGCYDPEWMGREGKQRVSYRFYFNRGNENPEYIFSYICSREYEEVADAYNLYLVNKMQEAISKIDRTWEVEMFKNIR